jgi:hypothetical protein
VRFCFLELFAKFCEDEGVPVVVRGLAQVGDDVLDWLDAHVRSAAGAASDVEVELKDAGHEVEVHHVVARIVLGEPGTHGAPDVLEHRDVRLREVADGLEGGVLEDDEVALVVAAAETREAAESGAARARRGRGAGARDVYGTRFSNLCTSVHTRAQHLCLSRHRHHAALLRKMRSSVCLTLFWMMW